MSTTKAEWFNWQGKFCCTCQYWDGEREVHFVGLKLNSIKAQDIPQGRCKGKGNVLSSYHMSADHCPMYKRWHELP